MKPGLRELIGRGAHIVLCRADKSPVRGGWNFAGATFEDAQKHLGRGGEVGLIPSSLGLTALDVDRGKMSSVTSRHEPAVVVASRRREGHAYYRDDVVRRNGRWEAYGAGGDVRSGGGYAVLWGDAPKKLAGADLGKGVKFPAEVLIGDWVKCRACSTGRMGGDVGLRGGGVGGRNNALFTSVLKWAWARRERSVLEGWEEEVEQWAYYSNREFAEPLGWAEVSCVIRSVIKWVKAKYWGMGEKSQQARRGEMSGIARRQRTAGRDMLILRYYADGHSQREIAERVGCTRFVVGRAVRYFRNGRAWDGLLE